MLHGGKPPLPLRARKLFVKAKDSRVPCSSIIRKPACAAGPTLTACSPGTGSDEGCQKQFSCASFGERWVVNGTIQFHNRDVRSQVCSQRFVERLVRFRPMEWTAWSANHAATAQWQQHRDRTYGEI